MSTPGTNHKQFCKHLKENKEINNSQHASNQSNCTELCQTNLNLLQDNGRIGKCHTSWFFKPRKAQSRLNYKRWLQERLEKNIVGEFSLPWSHLAVRLKGHTGSGLCSPSQSTFSITTCSGTKGTLAGDVKLKETACKLVHRIRIKNIYAEEIPWKPTWLIFD